jgi:hypothetical protein
MDNPFLHHIYQQWQQENDNYVRKWEDFVKIAAHCNNVSIEQMIRILDQYTWFKKP